MSELWRFLRVRKKFWLLPLIVVARRCIGGLLMLAQGIRRRAVHLHDVLRPMSILGVSAYYHDSAAALLRGRPRRGGRAGRALHAQEARRRLSDERRALLPAEHRQATRPTIDAVAFYDKPFLKFERLLETYLAFAPRGFSSFRPALPLWIKEKLFQRRSSSRSSRLIDAATWTGTQKLLFSEHHLSHAASAFYPSPFERAAVLTMDGVGEWTTTLARHRQRHAT